MRTTNIAIDKMKKITREQFMEFFRSDDFHTKVTPDDCVEIFRTVLVGSSDITVDLLNEVISDYSVDGLEVVETDWKKTEKRIQ